MFECKYCNDAFLTTYARTQHLRLKSSCRSAYKRELIKLASNTRTWQVDDPKNMTSDMGHNLELVNEEAQMEDPMHRQWVADDRRGDAFGSLSLFEAYLATVSAKSHSEPISNLANKYVYFISSMVVPNRDTVSGHEEREGNRVDMPHAVPVVIDFPKNKNAGQPIRMEPKASPQEHVTGRLADDTCFEMADFINLVGLTSSERDTFFKLQLVSILLGAV
jgi:hypothetical protein